MSVDGRTASQVQWNLSIKVTEILAFIEGWPYLKGGFVPKEHRWDIN